MKHRMKLCELWEYKCVTITVNRNLSNCEIARKKFPGITTERFNERPRGQQPNDRTINTTEQDNDRKPNDRNAPNNDQKQSVQDRKPKPLRNSPFRVNSR